MNNEQKILDILAQMQGDMARMQGDIAHMKGDMAQMQGDLQALNDRTSRLEINQENVIIPRIQLLAEGQVTIQNQIKRISVIDSMQDDISTLKTAVRFLSEKVQQLENASGK